MANINPGNAHANPRFMTSAGTTLFFNADNGTHGLELWSLSNAQASAMPMAAQGGGEVSVFGQARTFPNLSVPSRLSPAAGWWALEAFPRDHELVVRSSNVVSVADFRTGPHSRQPLNLPINESVDSIFDFDTLPGVNPVWNRRGWNQDERIEFNRNAKNESLHEIDGMICETGLGSECWFDVGELD
ncbi:MAG TPA: hypothetical protein PKD54_12465 [Pirellulaceae bacterium]|nr:hypothetical protein [Pirellulaceae bacterium]